MGQLVAILNAPQEVAPLDPAFPRKRDIDLCLAQDAITRAVPDARTDVCCLLHGSTPTPVTEWLLCMVAAFGNLGCKVTAARLVEDRIEFTVDDVRVAMGLIRQINRDEQAFYRPSLPHASRKAALLGYYLSRKAQACRLRIDRQASSRLVQDICGLIMHLHRPKAVILVPQGLLLTAHEFNTLSPETLCRLQRGTLIRPPAQRHERPRMGRAATPRPPERHSARQPTQQPPAVFLRNRQSPAEGTTAKTGTTGQRVASAFCSAKTERSLKSAFRAPQFTARPRLPAQGFGSTPMPDREQSTLDDALICDAIRFRARGHVSSVVVPLLMATMILLSNMHLAEEHLAENAPDATKFGTYTYSASIAASTQLSAGSVSWRTA